MHMSKTLEKAYLKALGFLNVSAVARATGRAFRTLAAYRAGDRRVTAEAARELVAYLRSHADLLTKAADRLEAAVTREEGEND